PRQLLVRHDGARARSALRPVEALGLLRALQGGASLREEVDVLERQRHAALGEADGRLQRAGPRQPAEALVGGQPAAEVAGCRARLGPAGLLVLGAPGRVGRARRAADEVEHVTLTAGPRDQHEADAADAGHERLHHVERRADGDGGVHRVAAREQRLDGGARTRRAVGAAWVGTAGANANEACRRTGDRQVGSTWRAITERSATPSARAASTYEVSRITSTEPRTTRATRGE